MQLRQGQEVVPGYVLTQRIGKGMAGETWSATASGGISVAIKVVSDLRMLGGQRELRALNTIRDAKHPNLCPMFGFWLLDEHGAVLQTELPQSAPRPTVRAHPGAAASGRSGDQVDASQTPEHLDIRATPNGSLDETQAVGGAGAAIVPQEILDRASSLVVAMALGEQTLADRLGEVRRERGLTGPGGERDEKLGGIDRTELIRYMAAAADAIDHLNSRHRIYHCDLKPQNLLLVGGQAQVCDFGLARRVDTDSRKTQTAFGTPAYGAPEMLLHRTYSPAIDQYSLAITYYELRTGHLPYEKLTSTDILIAKTREDLDFKGVSTEEQVALRRATQREPRRRFGSCSEFVEALKPNPSGRTSTPVLARPLVLSILMILVGIVIALAFTAWRDRPAPADPPVQIRDPSA